MNGTFGFTRKLPLLACFVLAASLVTFAQVSDQVSASFLSNAQVSHVTVGPHSPAIKFGPVHPQGQPGFR